MKIAKLKIENCSKGFTPVKCDYKSRFAKRKNSTGFTLIELMLAIVVFVISTASVAHLYIGAQNAADYSMSKINAVLLAREKIEEKREIRNEDGFFNLTEGTSTDTVTLDGRSYETTINVNYISEEVCKIEATISWTSRNKEESIYFIEHFAAWDEVIEVVEE